MRTPRVLVTSGDPGGVGPELVLRALADPHVAGLADFTVIGDPAHFQRDAAALGLPLPSILPATEPDAGPGARADGGPAGDPPGHAPEVPRGRPSAEGGQAAVASVRAAARLMAGGAADALVTAPVSKEALRLAGYQWPGQTEMLAELCTASDLRVLLMAGPLRVVHVTAHRSLRAAIDAVTPASVLRTIELADSIGRRLLGRPPRVAVAGLNPHAGEGGILGDEDEQAIRPAITEARSRGIDASGPLSADSLFPRAAAGGTDLVVAMYHDQGHIPGQAARPGRGCGGHPGPAVPADVPGPWRGVRHCRPGRGPGGQHDGRGPRRRPGRRARRHRLPGRPLTI